MHCQPGKRGPLLALGIACALAAADAPAHGAESHVRAALNLRPFVFETLFGPSVSAERGTLRVPESRSGRRGAALKLPVIRFAATTPSPGSPIVLLEGGPGQSGIDTARGRRFELIERLRTHGDVIILDQRGVGASSPSLSCNDLSDISPELEMTRQVWLDAVAEVAGRCAAKWRRKGVDLAAFNARESADDIDDLRQALGAERITLWGQSYGTQLALTVIRRHPDRVDRAILHGVLGHDHFAALPATTDKILRGLARLADRSSESSDGFRNMAESLTSLLAQLERAPVDQQITDPSSGEPIRVRVGAFEARFVINFIVLGNHDLMAGLPAMVAQMEQGDYSAIARLGLNLRRWLPLALRMAVACTTGASDKRLAKVERQAPKSIFGRLPRLSEVCTAWDIEPLGADFLAPVNSLVPALLISGTLDSVTPETNAREIQAGLRRSQRLRLVGATHSDLVHSDPRILDAIDDFLAGRQQRIKRISLPPWDFTGR